jgi:hypothetical protein
MSRHIGGTFELEGGRATDPLSSISWAVDLGIVDITFSFECSRPSRVRLEVDIISLVEYLVESQVTMECKGIVWGKNVSEEKERWKYK